METETTETENGTELKDRLKGCKAPEGGTLQDAVSAEFKKDDLVELVVILSKRKGRKSTRVTIQDAAHAALQLETSDDRWTNDGICKVINADFFPSKERETRAESIAWYRNDLRNRAQDLFGDKNRWQEIIGDAVASVQTKIDADESSDVATALTGSGFDNIQALLEARFEADQANKATLKAEKDAVREAKAAQKKADKKASEEDGDDDSDDDSDELPDDADLLE